MRRKLSETELGFQLESVCGEALLNSLPARERLQIEEVIRNDI